MLNTFLNECFKGEQKYIFILVREIRKNLLDLKIKEEGRTGNKVLRVHTNDDKAPIWYIHGYAILLQNLGLVKIKKKTDVIKLLNSQIGIPDSETKSLLKKINRDFGNILDDGSRKKLSYKSERFKKKKDYFRVKRKTL